MYGRAISSAVDPAPLAELRGFTESHALFSVQAIPQQWLGAAYPTGDCDGVKKKRTAATLSLDSTLRGDATVLAPVWLRAHFGALVFSGPEGKASQGFRPMDSHNIPAPVWVPRQPAASLRRSCVGRP